MLIDTHTHIYLKEFNDDRNTVIEKCMSNGINKLLLPNIDTSTIESLNSTCEKYSCCKPMMGLHPCSVKEDFEKELNSIKTYLYNGNYIAIGEIGIDLYWDKTTLTIQKKAFEEQINWAKELHLPIVIHARDSYEEIFEVLDKIHDSSLFGVFHCFTGSLKQAKKIIDYGNFKMGIGGVVTFKNGGLDKTLQNIELKHLMLETDSPYLSPSPYRGKRNESTHLKLIAEKLAIIYNCTFEEIAEITTRNAKMLFKLD
ncbi:MAG: TatD family hydrolase [Bacteroidota bacterium]|nr:TatD family hydrolase [Bacteroidota bacterium]